MQWICICICVFCTYTGLSTSALALPQSSVGLSLTLREGDWRPSKRETEKAPVITATEQQDSIEDDTGPLLQNQVLFLQIMLVWLNTMNQTHWDLNHSQSAKGLPSANSDLNNGHFSFLFFFLHRLGRELLDIEHIVSEWLELGKLWCEEFRAQIQIVLVQRIFAQEDWKRKQLTHNSLYSYPKLTHSVYLINTFNDNKFNNIKTLLNLLFQF